MALSNVGNESGEENEIQHEVFLGYSSNRVNEATSLKSNLEQKGFVCWLDVDDIDQECSFSAQDQIDQAIRSSKAMVACFDKEYLNSDKDIAEVSMATYLGKRVVAIDLEPNNWTDSKMAELMNPLDDHISFFTIEENIDPYSTFWPPQSFDELVRRLRQPYPVDKRAKRSRQREREPSPRSKSPAPPNLAPISQPEPPPPEPPPLPTIRPAEYHIITSCSPDILYDIQDLEVHFKYMGYRSKLMPLSGKRNFKVPPFDCNVLVCVLSPTYEKSKEAAQIIQTATTMKTDIVPLSMERNRPYPPKLMADTLDKFVPIDVSQHEPNVEWDHSKELDEIKARLRSLIPVVDANQQVKGAKLPDYTWLMPASKPKEEKEPTESRSRPRSRRHQQRASSARLNSALSSVFKPKAPADQPRRLISPVTFSDDEKETKKDAKEKDYWSDEDEDSWGDSKTQKGKTPTAKYVPPIEANQTAAYRKPSAEPEESRPTNPTIPTKNELPARSRTGASSSRSRRSAGRSSDGQMLKSEYRKIHMNN